MTATSSAPAPQAANGNTSARPAGNTSNPSRPADGNRGMVNLFANLLGLVSATHDTATSIDAAAEEGFVGTSTANGASGKGANRKDKDNGKDGSDPLASANPLADLIGWAGAPVAAPLGKTGASAAEGSKIDIAAEGALTDMGKAAATDATAQTADSGNGVSLQGMTLLAQPTTADANLLAQVKAGAQGTASPAPDPSTASQRLTDSAEVSIDMTADAQGAHPASAQRANALAASRPANWRSTATLGPSGPAANAPAAQATSTSALQAAQITQAAVDPRGRGDIAAGAPALRGTTVMDERFSSAVSGEAMVSALTSGKSPGSSSQDHSSAPGQGEPAFGAALTSEANELEAPSEAFSLDAALSPDEELDPNDFLSLGQLRHANVRVGEGTDEAIDIRLSLAGDAVNVSFLTDNADVRAGLQQNAGGSLSDLMQRSGLQLNGVSVGGQSQQPSGQSPQGRSGQAPGQGGVNGISARNGVSRSDGHAGDPALRPATARRTDGGTGLDVFA
jgi:flagellar hook-length control protein FliK